MEGTSKPLRTATYLLRFTPEEKAGLEQKVRIAAAMGKTPITLADALRIGANAALDEMIEGFKKKAGIDGSEGRGDGALIS